ncbi:DUF881 domain-containing protein [Cytobacillus sp. S13-E01]|uniref:DUF881 domain-containing protein n=1 Tax=Cytobacillus sp. S13-E01 TaxID=3031326 RepID=UPI0023D825E2|nr:DUF881 domain-containing protein [Cytobacillus sp. S13-E01]MDF0725273.1 DUF881 domain-containing protein [Cytobacillus sp. S13-E01]
MDKKSSISFTIVTVVIGIMIAVQFQTIKEPVVRDTRDTWELREDLKRQQELNSELLSEIYKYEEKIVKYESEKDDSKEEILRETLEELRVMAGLTEVTGPGIILTVEPAFNSVGAPVSYVSPELLRRLVNELNSYEADEISIDGHRVINTTVIREIQQYTKIDTYPIRSLPIEIKVITKDAEKLSNRMKVSNSIQDFFSDNLILSVSEPLNEVTVPAYEDSIRIKDLEPFTAGKGGKS